MIDGARVLVTGGAGFIGANLILRLLRIGCRIRATLHRRAAIINHGEIEYVKVDLTSMEDCKRVVEGVDYVFMCAANSSGAAVICATPLVHVTTNTILNVQILEAAYFAKVKKVLFLSSNAAYPPTGDRPVREEEMFKGDPYESYYGVGWMKRYTEALCLMYARRLSPPMRTIVIRPSNAYGPFDDFEFGTSHMTAALIRRVVERHNPLEVWGTGEEVRDLIYIDDLIDGMILAFEKTDDYDVFNIAAGKANTVKEVLQTIMNVDGFTDAEANFDPTKPSTISSRCIDITKAQVELGFKARTELQEGVRKTVEWYRNTYMAIPPRQ